MKRSPILPVGAAVAAVALSASPGLAVAKPVDKRDQNGAVSFPLLALSTGDHSAKPTGHVSHSSHVSHYSSSHNSHASHVLALLRMPRTSRRFHLRRRQHQPRLQHRRLLRLLRQQRPGIIAIITGRRIQGSGTTILRSPKSKSPSPSPSRYHARALTTTIQPGRPVSR